MAVLVTEFPEVIPIKYRGQEAQFVASNISMAEATDFSALFVFTQALVSTEGFDFSTLELKFGELVSFE